MTKYISMFLALENELERGTLNNSQFNKKLRKLNKRFGVSNKTD